jgi:hypothetical protein
VCCVRALCMVSLQGSPSEGQGTRTDNKGPHSFISAFSEQRLGVQLSGTTHAYMCEALGSIPSTIKKIIL